MFFICAAAAAIICFVVFSSEPEGVDFSKLRVAVLPDERKRIGVKAMAEYDEIIDRAKSNGVAQNSFMVAKEIIIYEAVLLYGSEG